jgi:hypothetical protein
MSGEPVAFMLAVLSTPLSEAPVPVGEVKTKVGNEVQPYDEVTDTPVGTPLEAAIVPLTTQFAPPPEAVKAVLLA